MAIHSVKSIKSQLNIYEITMLTVCSSTYENIMEIHFVAANTDQITFKKQIIYL